MPPPFQYNKERGGLFYSPSPTLAPNLQPPPLKEISTPNTQTKMKQILATTALLLTIAATPIQAQHPQETHPTNASSHHHHRHEYPRYYVGQIYVYFEGEKIEGASASTFTILPDGYAKDAWHVYFEGSKMSNVLSNSFRVLDNGYARDDWSLFLDGHKVKGARP